MALSRSDQVELVLPLMEELLADAPWDTFLVRLLGRTGADRVHLIQATQLQKVHRKAQIGRRPAEGHSAELSALGDGLGALRPSRVYAIDDIKPVERGAQENFRAGLAAAGIADARLIRVAVPDDGWLALCIVSSSTPFSASDSALLGNLAPAMSIAAAQQIKIAALNLRLEVAEQALAHLGIRQAILGPDGTIAPADLRWHEAAMANPDVLTFGANGAALRNLAGKDCKVVSSRGSLQTDWVAAADYIRDAFSLSPREASLATLIAQGLTIDEAGGALQLTSQSARTYSKRIYAKTGARGQADLVRIILSSLAVLC